MKPNKKSYTHNDAYGIVIKGANVSGVCLPLPYSFAKIILYHFSNGNRSGLMVRTVPPVVSVDGGNEYCHHYSFTS